LVFLFKLEEKNNSVNKRIWINIFLFVVVILLSIIILSDKDNIEDEPSSLSTINPDTISKIEIIRKNHKTVSFSKYNDEWKVDEPLKFPVNPIRIKPILNILKTESYKKLNLNEIDIAQFDLRDPKVILKLDQNNFLFGTTNPIDQKRYVLFNETIHLIDDYLFAQLMVSVYFFSENKLLPDDKKIVSIQFPDYKIYKNNGQWISTKKDDDDEKLKNIIKTWENAIAVTVDKYQLNSGSSEEDCYSSKSCNPTISVETLSGEIFSFSIEKEKPNLILGKELSGIQYKIADDDAIQMF